MLKLFKKKPQPQEIQQQNHLDNLGLFLIQGAENLLDDPSFQTYLYELKQLVSVTQNPYQSLYLSLVYKFAEFVQGLPDMQNSAYDHHKGLLKHAFVRALTALKYRRGYMLPVGADTETCYKQQEIWTYAIFTAALLKDIWQIAAFYKIMIFDPIGNRQYIWQPLSGISLPKERYYRFEYQGMSELSRGGLNTLLIKKIISDVGFHWLYQDESLFRHWFNYLNGILTPQNTIAEIIQKAEDSLSLTPEHDKNSALESNAEKENIVESTPKTKSYNIEISDKINEIKTSEEEPDIVEAFIDWVKQGIKNNSLTINQNESWMHRVEEGFLIMPMALEKFLAENSRYLSLFKDSKKDHLLIFIQKIQSANGFVPNNTGSYLHQFYVGEWKDRNVLQGVLLKHHLIEVLDTSPINKNLNREENIY